MKRSIEEQMKIQYEDYKKHCKEPKTYFQYATENKEKNIKALTSLIEEWKEFTPKKKVVIKVKKL